MFKVTIGPPGGDNASGHIKRRKATLESDVSGAHRDASTHAHKRASTSVITEGRREEEDCGSPRTSSHSCCLQPLPHSAPPRVVSEDGHECRVTAACQARLDWVHEAIQSSRCGWEGGIRMEARMHPHGMHMRIGDHGRLHGMHL